MTPAPMIALMVIIIAILLGFVISMIFMLYDHFLVKHCFHLCFWCKYKKKCDWYEEHKKKIDP